MSPRIAYALIGLAFILLIGGAWYESGKPASPENTITNDTIASMSLALSSTAFAEGTLIPKKYTCDGPQTSPPLSITGAPTSTKSFVLIIDDPDVPKAVKPDGYFLHLVLFNIPGTTRDITEGSMVGTYGANGAGKNAYAGPCPPPQYEPSTHHYVFHLYALDTVLVLKEGASKEQVETAMQGHVLGQTTLTSLYSRK
jgi:Raf kinase inhibitor-like YbhB/YbcL family protein